MKEGGIKILEDADRAAAELLLSHLLGLRGQIHESKGFVRLGRTLCLDPMSEYSDVVLRGALVGLAEGKAQKYLCHERLKLS